MNMDNFCSISAAWNDRECDRTSITNARFIRCAWLLSDFLGDNLPYNYRPHRVKITLTYAVTRVGVYSRDNILNLSLSNSYIARRA